MQEENDGSSHLRCETHEFEFRHTLDAFSRAPLSMTENSSFEMALQMPS